ncbi:MAG: RND family transporter, partial [Methanomicrobiales archaeon]
MFNPFETLATLIISRPKQLAAVFCLLLVVALYGMTMITMATGTDTYIDKDTRRGMLLDKYTKTFQSDSVLILIESDDVMSPDVLKYIDRLQKDLVQERYVTGASGISDLVKDQNGGVLPTSRAEITRIEEQVPPEILTLYVPSRTMTVSVVTVDQGLKDDQAFALVDNINKRVSLSARPPGVSVI